MSASLQDRTIFVTGAAGGIGFSVAKAFAEQGASIVAHDIISDQNFEAKGEELKKLGAKNVAYYNANLLSTDAVIELAQTVKSAHNVDVLVNNAGMQRTTSIEDADRELWDQVLAVNLTAPFNLMREMLPDMAKRQFGRVINIASVHSLVASRNKSPYVASKFGLVGLSKVAALEYADVGTRETGGVTINSIAPGWTETPLIEPQIEQRSEIVGGSRQDAIADLLKEKQPSLRMSLPSEIASLCVWLSSPVAHNVTGTTIPVDGGWTAT